MKIMVIARERLLTKMLVRAISLKHYNVEGLTNPEEALARLGGEKYDAVVLDKDYDIARTFETVSRIQKLAPRVRIVLMTQYLDEEVEKILGAVYTCVLKPLNLMSLYEVLTEIRVELDGSCSPN